MTIKASTATSKDPYDPTAIQVDEEDCIPIAEARAVYMSPPSSHPRGQALDWWVTPNNEGSSGVIVAEPTVFQYPYEEQNQAFSHSERVPLHAEGNYISTAPVRVLETSAGLPAYMKVQELVEKPHNMTVHRDSGTIVIKQKWVVDGETYSLMAFAFLWNGFMLFWNVSSITSGDWNMLLFASLHNAVGLFLIYRIACQFLNTTFVTVNHHEVEVKHTPLSFSAPKYFKVAPMQELDCKRCVNKTKNGITFYYEVNLIIKNANYPGGQQRMILLSNLKNPEAALFFAQEIESFLAAGPNDSLSSKKSASIPII